LGSKGELNCYDTGEGYPCYFEEYPAENKEQIKEILLANDLSRFSTEYYKKGFINKNEVIWYFKGSEGSECSGPEAMIFGKDRVIRFTTILGSKNSIPKEFDQILSTFKFLD